MGDGAEIGPAHPHRDAPAAKRFRPQTRADAVGEMAQCRAHDLVGRGLSAEGGLRAGRAGPAVGLDGTRVGVECKRAQLLAGGGAEQFFERLSRRRGELADGRHAKIGESSLGGRTDAPHQLDRKVVQELKLGRRIDDAHAVGLCHLRGNLGEMFGAGDADRDRQAELVAHTAADDLGDRRRRPEQMLGSSHVCEGLIDRDALDQRRVVVEHADRRVAEPLIFLEVAADEQQLRTEFFRPAPRHAAADAESLGLIRRREHHPAADGDRLATQAGVEQLFHRRVERIEIGMQDRCCRSHRDTGVGKLDGNITGTMVGLSSAGHRRKGREPCGSRPDRT